MIDDMTANEQNSVAGWFLLLGQILQTNAAQQVLVESRIAGKTVNINSKEIKCIYNPLFYDIDKLREIVNSLNPDDTQYTIDLLKRTMANLQRQINELDKEINKK